MKLLVRYLAEDDEDQILQIEQQMHQPVMEWADIEEALWGVFEGGNLLGVCTVGYAEDICQEITEYPGWTYDSLVISNVHVKKEYREKGIGTVLIEEVLKQHSGVAGNLVFLTLTYPDLEYFYRKLGFKLIDEDYAMVYTGGLK